MAWKDQWTPAQRRAYMQEKTRRASEQWAREARASTVEQFNRDVEEVERMATYLRSLGFNVSEPTTWPPEEPYAVQYPGLLRVATGGVR